MSRLLLLPLLLLTFASASAQEPEKAKSILASKYATLQEALDAVPATGGIVMIQPGNFEITKPLRVKTAETRIIGSGAATHIINKNEAGEPAFILEPAGIDNDKKARLWRVQMADLRISGNPKSGDGIFAHGIHEIYLHGVSVDHNGGNGIQLVNCEEDPRISDSILTYNAAAGLRIDGCHDIVVNANHFEENQDAVVCVDSFNLCCNANNIDDHLRHGIVIENTYGSVCTGNMIEECNGTAVILDRDAYGITLSANVIAHHLGGGIDLKDAWGCSVSANTFVLCHGFGVRLAKDSGRDVISGNAFGNSHIGAGQAKRVPKNQDPMQLDAGGGVVIEGAEDVSVNGNTFSGMDKEAVKATGGANRILVSNNLITETPRTAKDTKAIDLGDATAALVKDNLGAQ